MKLTFEELKTLAKSLQPELNHLQYEERMPELSPMERELSDEAYDKLHILIAVLTEIYKFRPLPF